MGTGTFMLLIPWVIAYYVIANLSIQSQKCHEDFMKFLPPHPFIDKPEKGLSLKRMAITGTINLI
jgi:hypothetical protein